MTTNRCRTRSSSCSSRGRSSSRSRRAGRSPCCSTTRWPTIRGRCSRAATRHRVHDAPDPLCVQGGFLRRLETKGDERRRGPGGKAALVIGNPPVAPTGEPLPGACDEAVAVANSLLDHEYDVTRLIFDGDGDPVVDDRPALRTIRSMKARRVIDTGRRSSTSCSAASTASCTSPRMVTSMPNTRSARAPSSRQTCSCRAPSSAASLSYRISCSSTAATLAASIRSRLLVLQPASRKRSWNTVCAPSSPPAGPSMMRMR